MSLRVSEDRTRPPSLYVATTSGAVKLIPFRPRFRPASAPARTGDRNPDRTPRPVSTLGSRHPSRPKRHARRVSCRRRCTRSGLAIRPCRRHGTKHESRQGGFSAPATTTNRVLQPCGRPYGRRGTYFPRVVARGQDIGAAWREHQGVSPSAPKSSFCFGAFGASGETSGVPARRDGLHAKARRQRRGELLHYLRASA